MQVASEGVSGGELGRLATAALVVPEFWGWPAGHWPWPRSTSDSAESQASAWLGTERSLVSLWGPSGGSPGSACIPAPPEHRGHPVSPRAFWPPSERMVLVVTRTLSPCQAVPVSRAGEAQCAEPTPVPCGPSPGLLQDLPGWAGLAPSEGRTGACRPTWVPAAALRSARRTDPDMGMPVAQ